MRIADYLDAAATRTPQKEAFAFGDSRMTYAQAQRHVHAIAHALRRAPGMSPSAHIGIYSLNDLRIPLIQMGINRADMACWNIIET